jgi:hypothetical protein
LVTPVSGTGAAKALTAKNITAITILIIMTVSFLIFESSENI